jgi:glycosyltransferase involved in cell wall biosynthesis
LRILHVKEHPVGGPFQAVFDVLSDRGYKQKTVALGGLRSGRRGFAAKIERYWPGRQVRSLIGEEIAAFDPDFIHVDGRATILATLASLPKGCGVPIIAGHGAINGLNALSPLDWKAYFSPRVDAILMPSHAMLNNWRGKADLSRLIPPSRCEVIHHPIRKAPVVDEAGRMAIRDELGLPRDAFIVGTACNVRPIKNIVFLVRCMRGLPETIVFAVFGGLDRLRSSAELKAMAGPQFRLVGHVPGARSKMAAFDAYVTPTRHPGESFGIATGEAMAAGMPVLTMPFGGGAEMVEHLKSGYLLPPVEAHWRQAILSLAEDEALRSRMGAAARHRIENDFSAEVVADRFEDMYRRRSRG